MYKSHESNLISHYLSKGLTLEESKWFASEKLKKLIPISKIDNYALWIEKLISFYQARYSCDANKLTFIDYGCGTGEIAALASLYGVNSIGYEIYFNEMKIAQKLANEISSNIVFTDDWDCVAQLVKRPTKTIGLAMSVVEHLSNYEFKSMLKKFKELSVNDVHIIVPSKWKVLDDHTGLPFLGVLPRFLSILIVKMLGSRYAYRLSESGAWDVWYRSLKSITKLSHQCGYEVLDIDESLYYPPTDLVPKIDMTNSRNIIIRTYCYFLNKIISDKRELYPYYNLILSRMDLTSQIK